MNERIRELAEQALKQPDTDNDGLTVFDNDELEKFAELIIRECAELTLSHRNDDYYNGWLDYRDEIRRHFGVAP
jgi:hypothetical protein